MHTVSVNLYAFEELAPEVQRKVVERERFINTDDSYWYEPIIRDWTEQLEKLGFQNTRILFSGFGSQGDGACFEARINIAAYLAAYHLKARYPLLAKYPEYVEAYLKHTGWYYHESSTRLVPYFNAEAVDPHGSGISDEETRVEKEYEALEKDISQEAVRLGRHIYTVLEDEFFHQISAEAVQDTLIANEYTYLADGRPFRIASPVDGKEEETTPWVLPAHGVVWCSPRGFPQHPAVCVRLQDMEHPVIKKVEGRASNICKRTPD